MKRKGFYFALVLLVLIQTGNIVYTFVNVKEGYNSDEAWSYGLSNSYYRPFLHLLEGTSYRDFHIDLVENTNQWISGNMFKDYITVLPTERFAYGSVYSNQVLDCHPPLYYMLLHTVCSFFPNQFSWWYGLVLNLVFFLGTQVFLFLASEKFSGSRAAAFLVCAFYGGGQGALCTFTFIRQYSLLTLLCVAFTYWGICLYRQYVENGKLRKSTLAAAGITSFLAFLTHYYAIAYMGVFTALFCLWLLLKRGIRSMFLYGGSVLAALLAAFAVFPAMFDHITRRDTSFQKLFPTDTQVRILISNMLQYNFGFATSYFETAFWNIVIPLVLALIVAAVLLLLPFRDEPWFPVLIGKLKSCPGKVWKFLHVMNYLPVFILSGCFSLYLVTALTVDVLLNEEFRMRFVCLTFPLLCMLAVVGVYRLLSLIPRVGRWAAVIVGVLVVCEVAYQQLAVPYPYSYKAYGDCGDLTEFLEEKRVLALYPTGYSHVMMPCLSVYLQNTDECFLAGLNVEHQALLQDIRKEGKTVNYVLVHADYFTLQPEAERKAMEWLGIVWDGEMSDPVRADCTDLIEELSGEDGYHLKGLVTIQGAIFYVLELGQQ